MSHKSIKNKTYFSTGMHKLLTFHKLQIQSRLSNSFVIEK